jgi:hypothetical protein
LRKSRQDEGQIDKDIDALLNKLDRDSSFASRLRESLLKNDASTAAKLVQSISVSKVSVMFESQGGSHGGMHAQAQAMAKGHFCWYRNGVRKCLYYSQC